MFFSCSIFLLLLVCIKRCFTEDGLHGKGIKKAGNERGEGEIDSNKTTKTSMYCALTYIICMHTSGKYQSVGLLVNRNVISSKNVSSEIICTTAILP